MNDQQTKIQELRDQVATFVAERDWNQFHTPKNLSMNLVREATELMEKFLWIDDQYSRTAVETNRKEIEDEAADVMIALLAFCNSFSIDISAAFEKKLAQIIQKYPVEKSKGSSKKYNKL